MKPGTEWIYVNNYSDTLIWEFTQTKEIEGYELAELKVTQIATNYSFYSQNGNQILKHAEILPKMRTHIDNLVDFDNLETDTLIIFSSPSTEYVLNQAVGYKWNKKVLIATATGYQEVDVQMEVTGKETLQTEAGSFICDVIKDELGVLHFVSEQGLIKTEMTVEQNDSTFLLTQELVKIVL